MEKGLERAWEDEKRRKAQSERLSLLWENLDWKRDTSGAISQAMEGRCRESFSEERSARASEAQKARYARMTEEGISRELERGMLSPEAIKKSAETNRRRLAALSLEEKEERLRKSFHSDLANRNRAATLANNARIGKYSGENSPNWRGGYETRYGFGWWAIREDILGRDDYICQGCGSKLNLMVHHIDGNVDNVDYSNLITVCGRCNSQAAHYDEQAMYEEKAKAREQAVKLVP